VANPNKPPQIATILRRNKDKLLAFLKDFHNDKDGKLPATLHVAEADNQMSNSTYVATVVRIKKLTSQDEKQFLIGQSESLLFCFRIQGQDADPQSKPYNSSSLPFSSCLHRCGICCRDVYLCSHDNAYYARVLVSPPVTLMTDLGSLLGLLRLALLLPPFTCS